MTILKPGIKKYPVSVVNWSYQVTELAFATNEELIRELFSRTSVVGVMCIKLETGFEKTQGCDTTGKYKTAWTKNLNPVEAAAILRKAAASIKN